MKKFIYKVLLAIPLVLMLNGCQEKQTGEQHKVHWDRDMCDRCKMVMSERNHAVQVINPQTNKAHNFDDIGCAILWFKEEKIQWKDQANIWIADIESAKWIDARHAFYDTEKLTPMGFGFRAYKEKDSIKDGDEVINFEELKTRILNKKQ